MPESHSATDGEDFATADLINEARRPILIARHRELITEMEMSLSESYITGQTEHHRLKIMIEELSSDSEVSRIQRTMKSLTEDDHYRDMSFQQGLVDFLCLMREEGNIEIAALQMHAIGVYRAARTLITDRQGEAPTLAELRELTIAGIGLLLDPPAAIFGRLGVPQVFTRTFIEQTLKNIKHLRLGDRPEITWSDAEAGAAITRADEESVKHLPENERAAAIEFLIRDRVRSRFYRAVFLEYLNVNEFDPNQTDLPTTILQWLHNMVETPHLYPFLQGQPDRQKAFRIARLTQKIVQVFEIYARVARAENEPRHHAAFVGKTTRERLSYLTKQHEPPIPFSTELSLAAMLCPFKTFVEFVQTRVQAGDFVLPPDPKR